MGLYRPCPLRRQPVQQIGPPIPPPPQPQTDLPPSADVVQPQQQTTVVLPQATSKPASRPSSTSIPINPLSIFTPPSAQPQSILKVIYSTNSTNSIQKYFRKHKFGRKRPNQPEEVLKKIEKRRNKIKERRKKEVEEWEAMQMRNNSTNG